MREVDGPGETIAGPLAASGPRAAVTRMWLRLHPGGAAFRRGDDGSVPLSEMFRQAGAAPGRL